jgi:hypothetical protein
MDLLELGCPITEEEVWAAIRDLPLDKAPGPMGSLVVSIGRLGRSSKLMW